MAARYIHLSGKQVDDSILRMYGLKKEEIKKDPMRQEPCSRCKTLNNINNNYCEKCWLPLTPQAHDEVKQIHEKDQAASLLVMKLMDLAKENPGIIGQAIDYAKKVNQNTVAGGDTAWNPNPRH